MKNKICPLNDRNASKIEDGCVNCLIRKLSLFDELTMQQSQMLNDQRTDVYFDVDEVVYRQGLKPVGLLCLSSGKVKIVKNNINGNDLIVALKRPGDFLGFYDLMSDDLHASSAIALEKSSVCIIPERVFRELLNLNVSLSIKINRFLAVELIKSGQRIADLTQKYMRARLADALLYIHDFYGTSQDREELDVELKRSDLAGLSNMSTPNAIRTLSEFAKSGLISVTGRKIAIKNKKELERISIQG